jgi:hypothetical protein
MATSSSNRSSGNSGGALGFEATLCAIADSSGEPVACVAMRMTWLGQEFVAKAKNDTIWKKVIAQAEEKVMSTSMSIIDGLLEAAAKKYVGLEK